MQRHTPKLVTSLLCGARLDLAPHQPSRGSEVVLSSSWSSWVCVCTHSSDVPIPPPSSSTPKPPPLHQPGCPEGWPIPGRGPHGMCRRPAIAAIACTRFPPSAATPVGLQPRVPRAGRRARRVGQHAPRLTAVCALANRSVRLGWGRARHTLCRGCFTSSWQAVQRGPSRSAAPAAALAASCGARTRCQPPVRHRLPLAPMLHHVAEGRVGGWGVGAQAP